MFDPLTSGVHKKVIYTEAKMWVSAEGSFKYVWSFYGHQASKS